MLKTKWFVVDKRCNYSAFNGGKRTESVYSSVTCTGCGGYWRTKANYVDILPDFKPFKDPNQ